MELADIGNPRKMAEGVIRQLAEVVFPLPIEDIALGLEIRQIVYFETDSFEGALITDEAKSNSAILVRATAHPERRRGHELGHYLMPLHIPVGDGFRCTSSDMRQEEKPGTRGRQAWEAEANAFAAELLMPSVEFKRRLRDHHGASIEALLSLAEDFGVSKLACGRKLVRLADDPCAIIKSKNGVVEQIYRHAEFPYISLRPGMSMPRDALASSWQEASGSISDVEVTDQCGWCSTEKRGLELYEQALIQADGWRLTLLTCEALDEGSEGGRSDGNTRLDRYSLNAAGGPVGWVEQSDSHQ